MLPAVSERFHVLLQVGVLQALMLDEGTLMLDEGTMDRICGLSVLKCLGTGWDEVFD